MSLSHELSGEIAAALLVDGERSPRELQDLKEMVLEIHSTLQQLTDAAGATRAARVDRHTTLFPPEKALGKAS